MSRHAMTVRGICCFLVCAACLTAGRHGSALSAFFLPSDVAEVYLPGGSRYMIPGEERVSSLLERAEEMEETGNFRRAAQYYSIAYRRARRSSAAPYLLFKKCSLEQSAEACIGCMKKILAEHQDFPLADGVRFELAKRLFLLGRSEQALAYLRDIENSECRGTLLFTPTVHAFRGAIARKEGRYDRSLEHYSQALRLFREEGREGELIVRLYLEMAASLIVMEESGRARPLLRRIAGTASSPLTRAEALFRLGADYRRSGEKAAACTAFQKLIRECSDSPFAPRASTALEELGDGEEAALSFPFDARLLDGRYDYTRPEASWEPLAGEGHGFAVQLGSFVVGENAEALARRLEKGGYAAFLVRVTVEGKEYYRVRVGLYESRSEAERVKEELEEEGYPGFVVREQ